MLERLRAVVGEDGIISGADAGGWAVHGAAPRAVVAPASAQEAAAVLALASAQGWTVEPAGAGTWLEHGRVPARVDLVLTSRRLTAIEEYEPADLTASVGAGLPLAALCREAAQQRQWAALDPPAGPGATVGAVVSLASAGPLRLRYGTPRDHVLGLQLVTGDGRVVELGGRVVKNVAGYDLVKLVTGSRGTLGLITRATLRLRPVPERDATLAVRAPERDALVALVREIAAAMLEPAALEVLSPLAAERVGMERSWWLLARLQGNPETVAAAETRLGALAAGLRLVEIAAERAASAWNALRSLEAEALLSVRLADRPSELRHTLSLAVVGDVPIAAHAGDGIVRILAGAPALRVRPAAEWATVLGEARSALEGRGGTLVVPRGPPELLERLDAYGDDSSARQLMRGLKKAFDPAGVLSPGRFVV